jgi:hypothetical protein
MHLGRSRNNLNFAEFRNPDVIVPFIGSPKIFPRVLLTGFRDSYALKHVIPEMRFCF